MLYPLTLLFETQSLLPLPPQSGQESCLAVEEESRSALLVAALVEEVQDKVLNLAVVAVQQLLEELGVSDAESGVQAVAHPQHPQVVHGTSGPEALGPGSRAPGGRP